MVTQSQKDAAYHCGIRDLLNVAYGRDFSMLEMGKCKTKFRTFDEWYRILNQMQKVRVAIHLEETFGP